MAASVLPSGVDNILGSNETALILRSIARLRQLLSEAQSDAKRHREEGLRPCYLLDWQELYLYMYQDEKQLETLTYIEYLFDQDDILFFLGPGTIIEMLHRIKLASNFDLSIDIRPDLNPEVIYKQVSQAISPSGSVSTGSGLLRDFAKTVRQISPHAQAIKRLQDLLQRRNFCSYQDFEAKLGASIQAEDAREAVFSALSARRTRESQYYPNITDSWNFATVVGLRRAIQKTKVIDSFPYLLTHTRPLLNETHWASDMFGQEWGFETKISREPLVALHSQAAYSIEKDPSKLMSGLVELEHHIDDTGYHLKQSSAYVTKVEPRSNTALEEAARRGTVPDSWRRLIDVLNPFINDPVFRRLQEVYDHIELAIVNRKTLAGEEATVATPRRLFDIISAFAKLLNEKSRPGLVMEMVWNSSVKTGTVKHSDGSVYTFKDSSGRSFLRIENYNGSYYALTWPTNKDLKNLLGYTASKLSQDGILDTVLFIGTEDEILGYKLKGEIDVNKIEDELKRLQKPQWVRFESEHYDLYFDIPTHYQGDSEFGLIVESPRTEDIADMYQATSARFLFQAWIIHAFRFAGM